MTGKVITPSPTAISSSKHYIRTLSSVKSYFLQLSAMIEHIALPKDPEPIMATLSLPDDSKEGIL